MHLDLNGFETAWPDYRFAVPFLYKILGNAGFPLPAFISYHFAVFKLFFSAFFKIDEEGTAGRLMTTFFSLKNHNFFA